MGQPIWLATDLTKHSYYVITSDLTPLEDWQQQYDIHGHAESILENNPNSHDLACAIFQLNRSIDFRERLLNKLYNFKRIPGIYGNKHHERMSYLGIIKPLLKSKLDKIRNNVMHSVTYPTQNISEVAELSEFTWYFLKSTDLIASRAARALELHRFLDDEQEEWLEVSFDPANWDINIRGKTLSENILQENSEQTIQIDTHKLEREDDLTYFHGKLLGPISAKQSLMRIYFSAL
ncbi:hypothetical protein [Microvirga puerhi]|uniref:Uncharacterized protein n=1 Tax=Microvirga puerhi TaxID=2876078 RepID=A0ABS7VKR1_9HYPH|nr:hypothetical protein [Microvirga puerhi]MBZ6076127.1 hypothetical protein [Microvirga puerhi]